VTLPSHADERHQALPLASDGSTALDVARRCARVAGEMVRAAAARSRLAESKGRSPGGRVDVVTELDPAIERAVTDILQRAFPTHRILGEETGSTSGASSWLWVVDPIDGTRNFSHGIPLVAFNLALCHEGEPRLGLTYDPLHEELFIAEAGGPATLNGRAIQVTETARLADALLGIDLGLDDGVGLRLLAAMHDLFPGVQAFRIPGSVALGMAYVAAGRLDAYLQPSPFAWDFAPGWLLVRQAGGAVSALDGTPLALASRSVAASGPSLHEELLARFRGILGG
jgi:fructose-1,6-bisphosphatase/inositol monophosphatase family enzyme